METQTGIAIGQVLPHLRKCIWLKALDREPVLRKQLARGTSRENLTADDLLIATAGLALNIIEEKDERIVLINPYRTVAAIDDNWSKLIAIIGHQMTYLELLSGTGTIVSSSRPSTQINENPSSYKAFLLGVASSYEEHARWFSVCDKTRGYHLLVDVGGGLGAWARAWVDSDNRRSAILEDLPRVSTMLRGSPGEHPRITFRGINLDNDHDAGPLIPDVSNSSIVCLTANVLHLFTRERRQTILERIGRELPIGGRLVVVEIDPLLGSGPVHNMTIWIRSGKSTQLIHRADLENMLTFNNQLRRISTETIPIERDVFGRVHYMSAWVKP